MWWGIRRMEGTEAGRPRATAGSHGAALWSLALSLMAIAPSALAVELSPPQAALYSSVSIYPPSASSMTVCYGFVCRRREILNFTPADRNALTKILAAGHASAAAELA